jgi:hypothetical protein
VKRVIFHPEADEEFAQAVAYYAKESTALAERFYEARGTSVLSDRSCGCTPQAAV